jgi:hypothetical protein
MVSGVMHVGTGGLAPAMTVSFVGAAVNSPEDVDPVVGGEGDSEE